MKINERMHPPLYPIEPNIYFYAVWDRINKWRNCFHDARVELLSSRLLSFSVKQLWRSRNSMSLTHWLFSFVQPKSPCVQKNLSLSFARNDEKEKVIKIWIVCVCIARNRNSISNSQVKFPCTQYANGERKSILLLARIAHPYTQPSRKIIIHFSLHPIVRE